MAILTKSETLVQLAAQNNAQWCNLVCETHGAPGQFEQQFWYSPHPVPNYYPNLVSLDPTCSLQQLQPIIRLMPGKASIKDSFNALDLSQVGFETLFEAQWLLAPQRSKQPTDFQLVSDSQQLAIWETGWSNGSVNGMFTSALLKHTSVRFIALYEADQLLGGAIAFKSEQAIGLSNIFCLTSDPILCWSSCLAAAQAMDAKLPLFTYQRDTALAIAQSIGFTALGPLTVWQQIESRSLASR